MAIDTRNKRAACLGLATPWRAVLPNPDAAAEDAGDRQQLAYCYPLAAVVPPVVSRGGGGSQTSSPDWNPKWQRFGLDALLPYDEYLRRKRKRERAGLEPLPAAPIAVPLADIQPNVETAAKETPGPANRLRRRQEAEDYVLLFSRPETLVADLIDAGEMGLEDFILLRGGDPIDIELFRGR